MEKESKQRKPLGRYHHGELRKALIDTALEMVETGGLEALTLRAVAHRLGVSHAAPIYHFPTKADLILAMAEEGFRLFADSLESALAVSPEGDVGRVGQAYIAFALGHPNHYRVMFGSELTTFRGMPPSFLAESERAFAVLARISGDSNAPHGLGLHSLYLWSLVHGMAMLKLGPLRSRVAPEDEAWLQSLMEEVIRMAFRLISGDIQGALKSGIVAPALIRLDEDN